MKRPNNWYFSCKKRKNTKSNRECSTITIKKLSISYARYVTRALKRTIYSLWQAASMCSTMNAWGCSYKGRLKIRSSLWSALMCSASVNWTWMTCMTCWVRRIERNTTNSPISRLLREIKTCHGVQLLIVPWHLNSGREMTHNSRASNAPRPIASTAEQCFIKVRLAKSIR